VRQEVEPRHDATKDDVGGVKPVRGNQSNEELRGVGVGSGVGHRKDARRVVARSEVLVLEGRPVNRLATRPITIGKVPTLNNKLGNHSMKGRPLQVQWFTTFTFTLFTSAQTPKVFRSSWHNVRE